MLKTHKCYSCGLPAIVPAEYCSRKCSEKSQKKTEEQKFCSCVGCDNRIQREDTYTYCSNKCFYQTVIR